MEKQNYEVKNVSVVETLYIQQKASKLTYHKPFLEKKKNMKNPKCIDLLCFIRRRLLCISYYHNVLLLLPLNTSSSILITRSSASYFVQYLTLYLEQINLQRNGKPNANTAYIYTKLIHSYAQQTFIPYDNNDEYI